MNFQCKSRHATLHWWECKLKTQTIALFEKKPVIAVEKGMMMKDEECTVAVGEKMRVMAERG